MAPPPGALRHSAFCPDWRSSNLSSLAGTYRQRQPFPHVHIPDFLNQARALEVAAEFPRPDTSTWIHYKHANEHKVGMTRRELFPSHLGELTDELNSPEFVGWLSELTGIEDLVPDPSLEGGGLHQSGRGGFLNIHTDFSMHHHHRTWRRRVNLVLYLTPGWREEWGGAIEFWDPQMRRCVTRYPALFNHAVIFSTVEKSFHGFADPLQCPAEVSRNSLALYYYTVESSRATARSTDYRARPGDGWKKSALIWLDKQAVDLYSRAKARFGFSDQFVSRILGVLSSKK